jgi:hypothetical protein
MGSSRAIEPGVRMGSNRAIEPGVRRGSNRAIEPVVRMGSSGADGMQSCHRAGRLHVEHTYYLTFPHGSFTYLLVHMYYIHVM